MLKKVFLNLYHKNRIVQFWREDCHEDINIENEGVLVRLDGFFVTDGGLYFSYNHTKADINHFMQYTFFEEHEMQMQETYLCFEFERRVESMGYRG